MSFVARAAARALSGGIRAMSTSSSANGVAVEVMGCPCEHSSTLQPFTSRPHLLLLSHRSPLEVPHIDPARTTKRRPLPRRCTTPAAPCGW